MSKVKFKNNFVLIPMGIFFMGVITFIIFSKDLLTIYTASERLTLIAILLIPTMGVLGIPFLLKLKDVTIEVKGKNSCKHNSDKP